MKKLHSGDPVIVISGKFKWKTSSIDKIDWDNVFVKWINDVKKAVKGKWFVKKHLPINISNVMYYDETKKVASKVSISIDKDWTKTRMLTKTGTKIK
jgi:ribosomal protein L24